MTCSITLEFQDYASAWGFYDYIIESQLNHNPNNIINEVRIEETS